MSILKSRHGKNNLIDRIQSLSLLVTTVILILIQLVSLALFSVFMLSGLKRGALEMVVEIQHVLAKPMYDVDDAQVVRISDTLITSGRIAGMYLESEVSGVLVDKRPQSVSLFIKPEIRTIEYDGIYLGFLELYFTETLFLEVVRAFFVIMGAVILAIIGANYFISRKFIQRDSRIVFARLIGGISSFSDGNYGEKLALSGYDDIDTIIKVINDMADKVHAKNSELLALNSGLETRIVERTSELEVALSEQKLLQERLVEAGKLTAVGELSAGIAHELNTPLGAIQASTRSLCAFYDESLPEGLSVYSSLGGRERELYEFLLREGNAKNRLITFSPAGRKDIEKCARALQERGIGHAEALATPLCDMNLHGSLEGLLPLLSTDKDEQIVRSASLFVSSRRMLAILEESTRKASQVVSALRTYLSPKNDEESAIVDIPSDINRVLTLMHNMLKHGVTVYTDFAPAKVRGSSDKLSQVWMNLIKNAVQAMNFRGELFISTGQIGISILVSIADTGPGIPLENQDKIFDPFFTTKESGEGMGLGLDICKKIVEMHQGTISFTSRNGRTEFVVSLPATGD